jgi:hypothetical protein
MSYHLQHHLSWRELGISLSVCTVGFSPIVLNEYCIYIHKYISDLDGVWAPQLFYKYFYNHAHRLRLQKLLYCILYII